MKNVTYSLVWLEMSPSSLKNITFYLQVHIVESVAFEVLLGRPFNILTESIICRQRPDSHHRRSQHRLHSYHSHNSVIGKEHPSSSTMSPQNKTTGFLIPGELFDDARKYIRPIQRRPPTSMCPIPQTDSPEYPLDMFFTDFVPIIPSFTDPIKALITFPITISTPILTSLQI